MSYPIPIRNWPVRGLNLKRDLSVRPLWPFTPKVEIITDPTVDSNLQQILLDTLLVEFENFYTYLYRSGIRYKYNQGVEVETYYIDDFDDEIDNYRSFCQQQYLDHEGLMQLMYQSRFGAKIFITGHNGFVDRDGSIDRVSWGASSFQYGVTLLLGDKVNRNYDFFRKLVVHELGHLFGVDIHHNTIPVEHQRSLTRQCVMQGSSPHTTRTCDHCRRFQLEMWRKAITL